MIKTVKLIINVTEKHKEMVEKIVEKKCALSASEVIRWAITEAYKREFPDYIQVQREKNARKESVEERALRKTQEAEIREDAKHKKVMSAKAKICEALGGETEMINNQPHCKYQMFTEVPGGTVEAVEMTEPYDTLTENSVEHQYRDIMGNTGKKVKAKLQAIR